MVPTLAKPGGRALVAIAGLARLVSCVGPDYTEQPPTKQECPHCGFAEWSCAAGCSPLLGIEYNFTHETYSCFEAIPANDRTLFWDTDAYCLFPEANKFIQCENMEDYRLENPYVLFLERCTLSSTSTITVVEECHWTCKFGRPFYRCKWTFDPEGKFDHAGTSTLEKCWLQESCSASYHQKVNAVCRPLDIWTQAGLNEQEKSILQEQLSLLGTSHTDATKELIEALTAAGLTKDAAAAAWTKYNTTVDSLTANSEALKAAGDLVADTPYAGETVLTTVLVEGVDYMLVVANSGLDSALEDAVKKVVSDAAGASYTTDDVKVAFRRGSLLIEAALSTPGAVTATMVQLKLQGSSTLGDDILTALSDVPAFKTSAVGPVSVGSVGVEVLSRTPQSRTLNLADEVERYREKLAAARARAEASEEKADMLTIVVMVLAALVGFLLCAVMALCIMRKRTSKVVPPTETEQVVIGRPVGSNQDGSQQHDGKPGNNGLIDGRVTGEVITAVPLRTPEKAGQAASRGTTSAASGTGLKGLEV